ncbi:MAG: PAS domain-containing protein [Proteobacteria bacterium]|nr:PAS domain-containing protein [Pseudomonadota bacterium]
MSLQGSNRNQPDRSDLVNVEHENLHGGALDALEGPLGEFFAYFRRKMKPGRLLSRADVKPEELKPHLLNIVILDLVFGEDGALDDVILRLIGSNVERFYGKLTGRSVTEHPNKNAAARACKSVSLMVDLRAPVLADTRGELADGNILSIRSLYIPLAQDGQTIDKAVVYVEIKKGRPHSR